MENLIFCLNATIPIFLTLMLGLFFRKIGLFDDTFVSRLNKFVFNAALPALLFLDIAKSDFYSVWNTKFVLFCFFVTLISIGISTGLSYLLKPRNIQGEFIQASYRSSAAILGIAIIQNLYGNAGMAPLMIVAAVPLFNIFAVVVLTFKAHPADSSEAVKAGRGNNIKKAFVNILKNPIIIGIVLGFISSILNMKYPAIINKTIESLAQTATPIALICIGAGFEGRKALKKIKPTIIATFIKLIGLAAVFIPVAVFLGFRNQELVAALIMLASPTTVTSYVMAKSMDNDEVLSSSIIVLTTVLSSITLTGWIFILRALGLI